MLPIFVNLQGLAPEDISLDLAYRYFIDRATRSLPQARAERIWRSLLAAGRVVFVGDGLERVAVAPDIEPLRPVIVSQVLARFQQDGVAFGIKSLFSAYTDVLEGDLGLIRFVVQGGASDPYAARPSTEPDLPPRLKRHLKTLATECLTTGTYLVDASSATPLTAHAARTLLADLARIGREDVVVPSVVGGRLKLAFSSSESLVTWGLAAAQTSTEILTSMLKAPRLSEAKTVALLWARQTSSDYRDSVARALLDLSEDIDHDEWIQRLDIVGTLSEEVALSVERGPAFMAAFEASRPSSQQSVVEQLSRGRLPERIPLLVDMASNWSYLVRWNATKGLAASLAQTYPTSQEWAHIHLEAMEAYASSTAPVPNSTTTTRGLLAFPMQDYLIGEGALWAVPSAASQASGSAHELLDRCQRLVATLVSEGKPGAPGAEASLAQGYRYALHSACQEARVPPEGLVAGARQLAVEGRFWFSRLAAIQGLAWARSLSDIPSTLADPHALVAAAARICRQYEQEPWMACWGDESEAIASDSFLELAPEAAILLSEVVLLLNHSGNMASLVARDAIAIRDDLPRCMTAGDTRRHLGMRTCDCDFRLCMQADVQAFQSHRGGLSRSMARYLQVICATERLPEWFDGSAGEFLAPWREAIDARIRE